MIKALCLTASVLSCVVPARFAVAQQSPPINRIAHLDGRVPGNTTYRAVELKTPWLYGLDRDGDLHVYKIPRNRTGDFVAGFGRAFEQWFGVALDGATRRRVQQLQLFKTIENAGDGGDLELFDDVLALTSTGKLAVFDVTRPSDPVRLGAYGPESATDSQAIVRAGEHTFVLGSGYISSFDMSKPAAPNHLATLHNEAGNWSGCYDGQYLYISEVARRPRNRTGIAVYDVSDPQAIAERHFVRTERAAYHVFVNSDGYLLASLDSRSPFHFVAGQKITVAGSTQIFKLDAKNAPTSLAITKNSGGRSALATDYRGTTILICNGLAFSSETETLRRIYSFFPGGSTLDGFPYHGDHDDRHAALATDDEISVFAIGDSPCYRLGKDLALALVTLVLP